MYAADLKSVAPKGACGFDSHPGHSLCECLEYATCVAYEVESKSGALFFVSKNRELGLRPSPNEGEGESCSRSHPGHKAKKVNCFVFLCACARRKHVFSGGKTAESGPATKTLRAEF